MLLSNLSLILEGGGMRGMFSAGVFDAFLEKRTGFPAYRRGIGGSLQYTFVYVGAKGPHQADY